MSFENESSWAKCLQFDYYGDEKWIIFTEDVGETTMEENAFQDFPTLTVSTKCL